MGNFLLVVWCIGAAGVVLGAIAQAGHAGRWPSRGDCRDTAIVAIAWPVTALFLLAWAPVAWWRNRLAPPPDRTR